ncbi:MAG: LysR substrate-binding domain-containing protein [Alphaproteobacteria bacterium]|nr:LysR substrate-binding domain-containing protein [Alphaproteobacteria bacterium]
MKERPIPSLNALRSFDATARHFSQTKAADELCVTPSAVSKQIALLEEYFGFALFEREQRGIRLTERGAKCARVTTQAFSQLSRELQKIMQPTEAPLRILCDLDFAQLWLLPRLDRFRRAHSGVTLDISVEVDAVEASADHDCVLFWGQRSWGSSIMIEPVFLNSVFLVAAPESEAKHRFLTSPSELRDSDLINDRTPGWWERFCVESGLSHLNPHNAPTYPTTAMCMEACALGFGLAVADEVTSRSYLEQGRVEILADLKIQTSDAYYAAWRYEAGKDSRIDTFRNWILEEAELHRRWMIGAWDHHFAGASGAD